MGNDLPAGVHLSSSHAVNPFYLSLHCSHNVIHTTLGRKTDLDCHLDLVAIDINAFDGMCAYQVFLQMRLDVAFNRLFDLILCYFRHR